jgi:hypothetical protein
MKKLAATLFGASLLVMAGAAVAGPLVDQSLSYDRDLRAQAEHATQQHCLPANGAQIMGGFAASGDALDAVTGQPCGHR